MKRLLFITLMMTTSLFLFGQKNHASNVNWEYDESEGKIVITYDLSRDGQYRHFSVNISAKADGKLVSPVSISGEVGSHIIEGLGKRIDWQINQDIEEFNGALTIEVVAINPVRPEPSPSQPVVKRSSVPAWAGLGGVAAIGGGLLLKGIQMKGQSNDLYEVYKSNLDVSAPAFDDLTRDEHYDEANRKNKTGKLLIAAGSTVLVAGSVILIRRLTTRKTASGGYYSVYPQVDLSNDLITGISKPAFGIGMNLTF